MGKEVLTAAIGIPVKNGEKVIGYTLENIARSSYPLNALEIVIGNHGSTDKTVDVIRSFQDRLNITIVDLDGTVHKTRSSVRNRVLERAKSDIIIFIDADILISKDFVNEHIELHRRYPGAIVTGYTYGKGGMDELRGDPAFLQKFMTADIQEKYELLKSTASLRDGRERAPFIGPNNRPFALVSTATENWRAFWSCNMSMRRAELLHLGGFEESFSGWGYEDEEIAYRYCLDGKHMLFSFQAWGYHVPHPVDVRRNLSDGKDNLERFFNKYQNGELEGIYYDLKADWVLSGDAQGIQFSLSDLEFSTLVECAADKLGSRTGMRLGICMQSEAAASRLDLTHCLLSLAPSRMLPYDKDGRRFYSLLGMKTAFRDFEFDETIVAVDSLMFFNKSRLLCVLFELSRISKKFVFLYGTVAQDTRHRFVRGSFDECLTRAGLKNVTGIHL